MTRARAVAGRHGGAARWFRWLRGVCARLVEIAPGIAVARREEAGVHFTVARRHGRRDECLAACGVTFAGLRSRRPAHGILTRAIARRHGWHRRARMGGDAFAAMGLYRAARCTVPWCVRAWCGISSRLSVPLRAGVVTGLSVTGSGALTILRPSTRAISIATHALRWRAEQFLDGEFPVVILVEVPQRLRRACNFIFGDHSVVIPIQRGDHGGHVRTVALWTVALWTVALWTVALWTIASRSAFAGWWSRRTILRLLCSREPCGQGERERDHGGVVFHGLVLVWLFWVVVLCETNCRWSGGEDRTHADGRSARFIEKNNPAVIKGVCGFQRGIVKEV